MKTEISWNFLGLVAAWLAAGVALFEWPQWISVATFAFVLIGWIVSLCLHEYAHAATASAFGDHTIVDRGYLTLNPVHYFRGASSLILPVIALIMGGIALPGGAVIVRNDLVPKPWQQSLIALAGPLTTLACAIAAYAAALYLSSELPALFDAFMLLAFFELMAFVLNMLPVPGLDGFAAVKPWLPKALTNAIPPQVGGLIMVGMLLAVFFYGAHVIFPIMRAITDLFGIDMSPVGRGFDRFHFWS
ncbi:MAG TPA: site-2 protease family protein [Asticcacaulis sp.]|nr:site-2 protease family protein [Asticcacaulis sp.]